MANRDWPTVTSEGIEGTSPTEIRENYVELTKTQYQAVTLLITACLHSRRDMTLPEALKLALLRVEREFSE